MLSSSWWQQPWQLATYSLFNPASFGGLIHLAFGMFWLHWIGRDVEEIRGSALVLSVWCFSVVVGGLMTALAASGLGMETPAFMGPWAGVIGVMVAACLWFPDKRIWLFVVGPIRLWYVVAALVLLELLRPASGLVSAGGAASAWLFVWLDRRGVDLHSWADRLISPPEDDPREIACAAERRFMARRLIARSNPGLEMDEIDRILDKINAEGFDALTDSERRALKKASRQ